MSKAESYPGPSQTSKMERFAKIVKKSYRKQPYEVL